MVVIISYCVRVILQGWHLKVVNKLTYYIEPETFSFFRMYFYKIMLHMFVAAFLVFGLVSELNANKI